MSDLPIDITNCLKNLPTILYRGDQSTRVHPVTKQSALVHQYNAHGLLANLAFGGNPLAIASAGIQTTISQHIAGWAHSHYLSFSSDLAIAQTFAIGHTGKALAPTYNQSWDAVVFSFDISQMTWSIKSLGVYIGTRAVNGPPYFNGVTTVALIDCVLILSALVAAGQTQFQLELTLAQQDKEWLIMPLDPMPPGTFSHIGYSAILQRCLISGNHFDLI